MSFFTSCSRVPLLLPNHLEIDPSAHLSSDDPVATSTRLLHTESSTALQRASTFDVPVRDKLLWKNNPEQTSLHRTGDGTTCKYPYSSTINYSSVDEELIAANVAAGTQQGTHCPRIPSGRSGGGLHNSSGTYGLLPHVAQATHLATPDPNLQTLTRLPALIFPHPHHSQLEPPCRPATMRWTAYLR